MEDWRALEKAWAEDKIRQGKHVEPGPYLSKDDIADARESVYWQTHGGKPTTTLQDALVVELIKMNYGKPFSCILR